MAEAVVFAQKVGEFVIVQNLQKAPEHNGKLGVVKELLEDKGRITVKVFESDKAINVRGDNLRAPEDAELKTQLKDAFSKLERNKIENILVHSKVEFSEDDDKAVLIAKAVEGRVVPEAVKKVRSDDDMMDVPGMGRMSRRDMKEQAQKLEGMSMTQMRDQLRVLTSSPPSELRAKFPHLKNMPDEAIEAQIKQYQMFVNNPKLKKAQVEALKTGDFTKLQQEMTASLSDEELKSNMAKQLEAFRKDPKAFRRQYLPDADSMTDKDIEEMLESQANADAETLRAAARGNAGPRDLDSVDFSKISEEQYKKQAEAQIKMFKANPKQVRAVMEKQSPEVKNLSDTELLNQLEMAASMSKKDMEEMSKMAKQMRAGGQSGGAPAAPNFDNMSGEQIQRMMRAQLDMVKRDPSKLKSLAPQFGGMSDETIISQMEMMANMDPSMLKMFMSVQSKFGSVFSKIKGPLDKVSGGRGQQIIGLLMLLVGFIVVYFLMMLLGRLMSYLFPTTFGFNAAASTSQAGGAAAAAAAARANQAQAQVDLNVEDDAFFQQDEDL